MKHTNYILSFCLAISFILGSCSGARYGYLHKVKADKPTLARNTNNQVEKTATNDSTNTLLDMSYSDQAVISEKKTANPQIPHETFDAFVHETYDLKSIENNKTEKKLTGSIYQVSTELNPSPKIDNNTPPNQNNNPSSSGTDGFAVTGFILSIVGLFIFGLLFGALAIIFSAVAMGRIKKSGKRGNGLAIAGLVIGVLDVILVLVFLSMVS